MARNHGSIKGRMAAGKLPNPYELRSTDVNTLLDQEFGLVIRPDVGKRVYLRNGIIQMENDEQVKRRKEKEALYAETTWKGKLEDYEKAFNGKSTKGKGWREAKDPRTKKAPRHSAVAHKKRTEGTLSVRMEQYPRLREFVRNYLNNEWDEAARSPQDVMESMGWIPHSINSDKFYEFMNSTMSQYVEDIVNTMVQTASTTDRNDDLLTELLVYQLTGDLPGGRLPAEYQKPLANHLGDVLSDGAANWIAEGFNKSRVR